MGKGESGGRNTNPLLKALAKVDRLALLKERRPLAIGPGRSDSVASGFINEPPRTLDQRQEQVVLELMFMIFEDQFKSIARVADQPVKPGIPRSDVEREKFVRERLDWASRKLEWSVLQGLERSFGKEIGVKARHILALVLSGQDAGISVPDELAQAQVEIPVDRLWRFVRTEGRGNKNSSPIARYGLPFEAAGNVRFVFMGGALGYTDRRGSWLTDTSENTLLSGAEEASLCSTLIASREWLNSSIRVANDLLVIGGRTDPNRAWCFAGVANPARYRGAVRRLTGRQSYNLKHSDRAFQKPAGNPWVHYSWYGAFSSQIRRGNWFTVKGLPSIAIWGWLNRGDEELHSFLHVLTDEGRSPLTVLLPDLPCLREFAVKYNSCQRISPVPSTLFEFVNRHMNMLKTPLAEYGLPLRGDVWASQLRVTEVVEPDGSTVDGFVVEAAIRYLLANFELQLSPWDVARDDLLRGRLDLGAGGLFELGDQELRLRAKIDRLYEGHWKNESFNKLLFGTDILGA